MIRILLLLGLLITGTAHSAWFNVVTFGTGARDISFEKSDAECEKLMLFYSKRDNINFFSCDEEPLPGAILVLPDTRTIKYD